MASVFHFTRKSNPFTSFTFRLIISIWLALEGNLCPNRSSKLLLQVHQVLTKTSTMAKFNGVFGNVTMVSATGRSNPGLHGNPDCYVFKSLHSRLLANPAKGRSHYAVERLDNVAKCCSIQSLWQGATLCRVVRSQCCIPTVY